MSIHMGKCRDRSCGKPLVAQREWNRNPKIRPGRAKYGGYGMCQACYVRARRQGRLPEVTITPRYPVTCDKCGLVGEAASFVEAKRCRAEHLTAHGFGPVRTGLSEAELASLRRMVGVA